MADFFGRMLGAQRGWSIDETANKLTEVSAKGQECARLHDEGYALITAQNAAAATRGRTDGQGIVLEVASLPGLLASSR